MLALFEICAETEELDEDEDELSLHKLAAQVPHTYHGCAYYGYTCYGCAYYGYAYYGRYSTCWAATYPPSMSCLRCSSRSACTRTLALTLTHTHTLTLTHTLATAPNPAIYPPRSGCTAPRSAPTAAGPCSSLSPSPRRDAPRPSSHDSTTCCPCSMRAAQTRRRWCARPDPNPKP